MSIQVTSINGQPYINGKPVYYGEVFPHRNLLINGGFDVWQRGTSFSATSNIYTADRWESNNQNISYGEFGTDRYINISATTSTYGYVGQKIEDGWKLKGKTVTLSFRLNNVSDTGDAYVYYKFESGAGIGNTDIDFTTNGNKQVTFTLPSDASIGDYLELRIQTSSGGTARGSFDLFDVQLEEGSVATPFEQVPIADTLARCQRYYEVGGATSANYGDSTGDKEMMVGYRVIKREDAPTVTINGGYNGSYRNITNSLGFSLKTNSAGANTPIGCASWNSDAEL